MSGFMLPGELPIESGSVEAARDLRRPGIDSNVGTTVGMQLLSESDAPDLLEPEPEPEPDPVYALESESGWGPVALLGLSEMGAGDYALVMHPHGAFADVPVSSLYGPLSPEAVAALTPNP